ncbi:amino acid ABC transporter substrate-binding protein [Phormidium tenue]|uniref:Amino acid ABC transporter substrate-binding protein n=2 Tax=Phormidium tenue TaxID=126344 RepID=A0ABR8C8I9_9CYAN|nr:amino acid ABC transporter substrate-binding protein [Phormidium tenue]MBD2315779.1 amino acid ABC transporter substrate-binding protein [Phormidium tenue FACHB-1050]
MPKHLPKTAAFLERNAQMPSRKTSLRQWCFFSCLTIALLSGCQPAPTPSTTVTPTATATPTATTTIKDKAPEGILERVKARGKLICGVNGKLSGFSYVDEKGVWSGLDVDYCQAIAAAVLGDAKAVEFKPLLAKDRFAAIQSGEIDVLMRNTTRTLTRDVATNISFAPTTFFDGQGVMLRIGAKPTASPTSSPSSATSVSPSPTASASPTPSPTSTPSADKERNKTEQQTPKTTEELAISLKELTDKKICVETGINATNLESTFKEANIAIESIILPDLDEVLNAYSKGDCEAISSEKSQLAAWRSKLPRPADHKILDLSLSREPLSPALVGNDDRWRDVVTWIIYATFYADELGINMNNYTIFKDTKNPEVARFLGTSDSLGIELGLAPDWTTQILKQVGNYSDIYNRNLAPLDIPRGLNRTWKQGGLLYSMPFR